MKRTMDKIMKTPCIKNKCLKYPICKHKEYIECEELRKYLIGYSNNGSINIYLYLKIIKHLQKTIFPNLEIINTQKNIYKNIT